jgi:glycosyltransferase involved in cell wall biosynthesis
MSKNKPRLLLIGPREGVDGKIGGIVVLFENLIKNLSESQNKNRIVDSNASNYCNSLAMLFHCIKNISQVNSYTHVSMHGTAKDYLILGPFILVTSILFRKTYSLRKFAGSFDEFYSSCNLFNKMIIRKVLKHSSANFFETISLVDTFKCFNVNTFWFPNVRPKQTIKAKSYKPENKLRILYLSQLDTAKGVLDLIEAVESIENTSLTIAGPIIDERLRGLEQMSKPNIQYVGAINNKNIYDYMSGFHCLVLPTYYSGEGYPGVIIEAFMVGLPVISTNWRSIPELVGNGGLLVEPKSVNEIVEAIKTIATEHQLYQERSIARSDLFDDSVNTSDFMNKIGFNHAN